MEEEGNNKGSEGGKGCVRPGWEGRRKGHTACPKSQAVLPSVLLPPVCLPGVACRGAPGKQGGRQKGLGHGRGRGQMSTNNTKGNGHNSPSPSPPPLHCLGRKGSRGVCRLGMVWLRRDREGKG